MLPRGANFPNVPLVIYSEVMYKMTIFKDYSENFISLIRMFSYKLQRHKPFWGWCPQTYYDKQCEYLIKIKKRKRNHIFSLVLALFDLRDDYTYYDDIHMSSSNSSLDLIHSNDIINTTHFKHQTNRCTTHTYFVNIYIGVYYSCSIGIDSNDNNKVLINFHEGNYCNTYWTRF
ncbi:hypothetical protein AGLY_001040 [Aphis glycines]|uniref:Uncharacterized protein n=1 Tax=Aphis glycines TaxID=307491 RepID=A0A6G0U970_APHGL|nr:hypothetical protein AGLY_001040 [Aphis glycines]